MVLGVISTTEALAGFSNPAPMTIAALFVIARAVEKTGALRPLVNLAFRSRGSEAGNLSRLLVPSSLVSALMNNTPIVAMLMGPVTETAERRGQSPARYLMPLSFAVLLGGTVTLIGTSTNLVVSGMMVEHGLRPLGMFEITWLALPLAAAGVAVLTISTTRLLPARQSLKEKFDQEFREFTIEMEVESGGPLVSRTVADAGLRHLQGVFLAWIRREGRLVTPIGPDEELKAGDRLGFVGGIDRVVDLQSTRGLRLAAHKHIRGLDAGDHRLVEVVLAPVSPLVSQTLKQANFREHYQASVLAIHRSGERISGKLGDVVLQPGDTLLLLGDEGFAKRWRDRREFLVVLERDGPQLQNHRKAWFVGCATLTMVILASLEWVPILQGSLVTAMLMVAAGVLTSDQARSSIDMNVVLLVAASVGLGTAIESSGLASLLAGGVVAAAKPLGTLAVLGAVVLATIVVTQFVTNNAAAALVLPIGLSAAKQTGADPRMFAAAVAIAASYSFMTPIGYQTNTMVYGPGGYRFSDYFRLGAPLTAVLVTGLMLLVALRWN